MKAAIEKTTRVVGARVFLVGLAAMLTALLLALAGVADTAQAKQKSKNNAGQIVFASDRTTGFNNPTGDREIFVMNPDGTELKQLTFNTVADSQPTLSPDGQKIVFVSSGAQSSNTQGDNEVYLMNSDGTDQQNLTNTTGGINDLQPDFSPSGKKIAFKSFGKQSSNLQGDDDIYLMNSDGTDRQNLTDTSGDILDFDPDFSPNGKKIAYGSAGAQSSNPEGDDEVYVMDSDGSGQQNLTDTNDNISDFDPDFSPDGKKIAYASFGVQSSNSQGDTEIYVMDSDGTDRQNITNTAAGISDSDPDFGKSKK
jgi:Tol biopolymer transport system component